MEVTELTRVAELVRRRNEIDARIASITHRPVVAGHLGEWIAVQIFQIDLETSAVTKALDGHFIAGSLAGRTVNIKWYGKREGLLDIVQDPSVDFYLVMAGPRTSPVSSRGATRPLVIDAVYLFEAAPLLQTLSARGLQIGVATSVVRALWDAAEVFPTARNPALRLSERQRQELALFSTEPSAAAEHSARRR